MRRAAGAVLVGVLGVASACASTGLHEADQRFAAGAYGEAAAAYRQTLHDSGDAAEQAHALFRLGLSYALPQSSIRDWELAQQYLSEVVERFPASSEAGQARFILAFEGEAAGLRAQVEEAQRLAAAKQAALARLRAELDAAGAAARQSDAQLQRLTADLQAVRERLARLSAELAALKKIDAESHP